MQHARLSPSSSSRWLSCTASVAASEQYKNTGNSAAQWGTNVHYMGEQLLKDRAIVVGYRLQETDDSEWFTGDKEMLEVAEDYADYVRGFINKKSVVLIEEKFDLSCISEGQFGTSDATVLNDNHLHVFDLKTGHNIVKAEENSQLMLYALGAVEELSDIYDIEEITLHIVQTRAGHIDSWTLSINDLLEFKEFAKTQAKAIIEGEVTFNPNTKGCQWCPHKVDCKALKEHVEKVITGTFDDLDEIDGKANLIDNSHIKKILDNADLITNFIKAVQEEALIRMEEGQEIDGYKLVEAKTNRKWINEEEVEAYLSNLDDGVDYYQEPKLLPMSKILKILAKDKGIEKLVYKPEGKPTIAPISDKRKQLSSVVDNFDEC